MNLVDFSLVRKDLYALPDYIVTKLLRWAKGVEEIGILEMRKIPGYHDEPLKGKRSGQRSIRLNRSYRALYSEINEGEIEIIRIEEVNKHEY